MRTIDDRKEYFRVTPWAINSKIYLNLIPIKNYLTFFFFYVFYWIFLYYFYGFVNPLTFPLNLKI